jgi:ankyrin repeat protein
VEIKNNIFWPTPGSYCIRVAHGCTENLVSASNVFFTDFKNDGSPPGFGFSMTENTETVGLWNEEAMTTDAWNKASKNNTGNGYTLEGPGLDKTMHLVASSVCIDRGVSGLVSDDMDGGQRPVGAGYDIGADEYGTTGKARSLGGEHEPPLEGQQLALGAPIHFAAYRGDLAKIEASIQEGVDINKLDARGYAPLHYAAQNNQKQAMELLIAKGGNVNVKNSRGQKPLFYAIAAGHRDVAELLISKGAEVNVKNKTGQAPLDFALSQNRKDIVEFLIAEASIHKAASLGDVDRVRSCLEKGADVNAKDKDGQTALHMAASNKRKEVAELLLSRGADINAKDGKDYTPLFCAIWKEDQDIVKLLVTKGADVSYTPKDDYPPLHYAVWNEDVNTVRLLVDHGAKFDVKDRDGSTAFREAASQGARELLQVFITKGADVSTLPLAACVGDLGRMKALVEKGADIKAKDELGWTPLYWAALTGQTEAAEFLVARGADVQAKTKDEATPLHQAASAGEVRLVELLIFKGAGVNVKDKRGNTPLHRAVLSGHKAVVELLIARGADASIRDNQGRTALNLAERQRDRTEIAEMLRKYAAKE